MDSMRVQSQRLLLNWKTNNTSSYLRALMHADVNIRYANYQFLDHSGILPDY